MFSKTTYLANVRDGYDLVLWEEKKKEALSKVDHSKFKPGGDFMKTMKNHSLVESDRRRKSMEEARVRLGKNIRLAETREEAIRAELLAREANEGEDRVGAEYFRSKGRFNVEQDAADPLFDGVKKNESSNWKEYMADGFKRTQEIQEEIKHSKPFSITTAETEKDGRLYFKTYVVGWTALAAFGVIFFSLLFFEIKSQYEDNLEQTQMLKEYMKRYDSKGSPR